MHLVRHREAGGGAERRFRRRCPALFAPDTDGRASRSSRAALADGRHWLDPIEIKRLFEAYDIPMVPTFAAADAEQAVAYAWQILAQGSTVVLKILSRDIVHKSDVGGVVLNLTSADAVRAATPRSWRGQSAAAGGAD